MKIEDISVFGEYKQPENRVTAAFLQICKIGGEDFIRFLTNQLKIQLPSSEIEIRSQAKGIGTVPDGLLQSNFSFKLYVESKIKPNTVDAIQLAGHQNQIINSNDFLLYLTPDDIRPAILATNTYWANWFQITTIFNDYLQTSQPDNKQLLVFLSEHFDTLLNNLNLLGYSWNLNNDNVIIVAGSWAEGFALKYSYYICQNNRSFQSARYLAFYNNNQIRHVFEIAKAPEDNVKLSLRPEFSTHITQADPGYLDESRKVFTLTNAQHVGPIINDSVDKNGTPCPYTYGQPRYTKLLTLQIAKKTSEL